MRTQTPPTKQKGYQPVYEPQTNEYQRPIHGGILDMCLFSPTGGYSDSIAFQDSIPYIGSSEKMSWSGLACCKRTRIMMVH
jgi:hypothetical protein